MSELFKPSEVSQDSPRLRWIKQHGIQTHHSPEFKDDDEYLPWCAWTGDLQKAIQRERISLGRTEDEAIVEWAKDNNMRLWNEVAL